MKNINIITQKIIEAVGGKENIISAEYYATVIRLKLADIALVSGTILENLEKTEGFPKGFFWNKLSLVLRFSSTDDTEKIAQTDMIKFKKLNLYELNLSDFDDFELFAVITIDFCNIMY